MQFLKVMAFLPMVVWTVLVFGGNPSDAKLKTLYYRLDSTSISQHLAFYELYSQSYWGEQALKTARELLTGKIVVDPLISSEIFLTTEGIKALVEMVNKPVDQELVILEPGMLDKLEKLSSRLHHISLKGHTIWSEQQLLELPLEEIDLARGLFISQFGNDRRRIQSYESLIDLIALQILARLPSKATPEQIIIAINHFIFDEMGFRFPPHSMYAKDIDLYTFLPSVLDSRRGVCLGVSILYLCIAQRLALPLEMITPPGHIYLRYNLNGQLINIETTARGIHLESEEYLSINIHSLQKRTILEVVGMAHFNQASVHWQNREYEKALSAYQKAERYLKNDPLLKELMGYVLLITGHRAEGEEKLKEIKDHVPEYAMIKNNLAEDYFLGRVDAKGIDVIFTRVNEDRQSILVKKKALEETLERYPDFRSGIFNLAIIWLQLHRIGEALEVLNSFLRLDQEDLEVHYYLSILHKQRFDFPKAWKHLQLVEAIVNKHNYHPKILKELRRDLLNCCPE